MAEYGGMQASNSIPKHEEMVDKETEKALAFSHL